VNPHQGFNLAIVNNVWTLLSGERYEPQDPQMTGLVEDIEAYIFAF